MKYRTLAACVVLLPTLAAVACSAKPGGGDSDSGSDSDSDSNSDASSDGIQLDDDGLNVDGDGDDSGHDAPAPPGCGDGTLTSDEVCDDGNKADDDGCWANCRGIDKGFTCPTPGELCKPFARCGDGIVSFPEQCDDGGVAAGDGCAANCKFELGYVCGTVDGAYSCRKTVCGDGIIEGTETCEDGNVEPFDGCSASCVSEPNCDAGACTSSCGDGIVLGEDCDDGNTINGDGCSSACKVEGGYNCSVAAACDASDANCEMHIPVIFRDFDFSHSDFEEGACMGQGMVTGLLNDSLTNGKPVVKNTANGHCMTNFAQWYVSNTSINTPYITEFVLYPNAQGNFANRFGPGSTQFHMTKGWACTSGGDPCLYDGNPFFFPVDGIPNARDNGGLTAAVSVTGNYGMDGTTYTEQAITGNNTKHNFSFTTEITYWFQYDSSTSPVLDFLGDDDVWVFINGKLAVDLGNVHPTAAGSVTLNSATATKLGLENGKVYAIKIFHAERLSNGSTFRLTLSQFSAGRSDCGSTCGDGIIGFPEECDDGVNDGGYNECQPGCVLGGYCGDGIVQESEACDDADPNRPANCHGCRIVVVK